MELTLQDSGKQFPGGTVALKHVNLSVSQGEFVSVIGPSCFAFLTAWMP